MRTSRHEPELRLRSAVPELVDLPWLRPLGEWSPAEVDFRDVPVGPSRHLVRFVHAGRRLWALKELPAWVAEREYEALREMERRGLPAVRAAGLAIRPDADDAVLITEYLSGCWQYRRLLMRIPFDETAHRQRLFDAMAGLLVELHRHGVYWGDCSLANTLFKRDGQVLQAHLVDAETAEVHPALSDGQRRHDLEILEENLAGGLMDLAMRLEQPPEVIDQLLDEARAVTERYEELWSALHDEPTFRYRDRRETEARIRRLNELGFAVDEVRLVQVEPGQERRPAQGRRRRPQVPRRGAAPADRARRGGGPGAAAAQRPHELRRPPGQRQARRAGRPAVAARGGRAGHGPAGRAAARAHRPGAGLLRPAGGAVAAQRAGGP